MFRSVWDLRCAGGVRGVQTWSRSPACRVSITGGRPPVCLGDRMHRLQRRVALAMLALSLALGAGWTARAQSTGTLQGTVTDASGAVVAGAKVTATETKTGVSRSVTSDSAGSYALPALNPGTYRLVVNAAGMQAQTLSGIVLAVDSTERVDVKLGVASTAQTVEVTAAAEQMNTSNMTVGQVIGERTVQQIPLNGRHFLDLGNLIPGSVTAPQSGFLTAPLQGLGAASFDTAGNREDTVNFMINGINLNDMSQNQITFQPSVATVSEFKVDNSSLSAEYGRDSGAVVNVATRSGTNEFHGEAFDYIRNNDVDARNYFNPSPVPMSTFKRNNPGVDVGGPVLIPHIYDGRNRTFFFVSYEGLLQSQGLTINSGVPTNTERASVTDPIVQKLLTLVPTANDSTGTRFLGSASSPVTVEQFTGDLLHNISATDQLHFYYAWQQDKRNEPTLPGETIPNFGDHRTAHRQIGTLVETHEFGSNVVNEARLGFNRIAISFAPNFVANPVSYGINNGVGVDIGLPQIAVSSIGLNFGGPAGEPQGRFDTTMVFSDNVSWLRGKHSLDMGGEFRRFVNDNFNRDTSTFVFSTVNSFLADQAIEFIVTPQDVVSRIFENALGAYVQDVYRVNSRLSLQFGLRFDWDGTPTEGANRFVDFNPATMQLQRVGTPGFSQVYSQNYSWNPRAGFIWDVTGLGKTVLRGGFTMQNDEPVANLVSGLASNPPFAAPVLYTSNATTPYVTFANAFTAASGLPTLSPTNVARNFSDSYVESYNLNLQQQLPWGLVSQLAYVGSHGVHLRLALNQNQPINGVRPYAALSAQSPYDPSKGLGNITEYDSIGSSHYNALWATLTRRFANGLDFNTSYTWSKSMDLNSLSSQGVILQNSYDPANNYGLSDFDARNRWVFSSVYALPFGHNRLTKGWQLSAIAQLQSGNPLTVVTTSALNGTFGTVRPDILGTVQTEHTRLSSGAVQYLPQSLCYNPTSGCVFSSNGQHFGNEARNSISGPGFEDVDFSVQKDTTIYRNVTLEIRADAFNILNHPNFGQPLATMSIGKGTITTGSFGEIVNTRFPVGDVGSSRQMQLAGRIFF